MEKTVALLLTDLVDSAATAQRLGDAAMAEVNAQHDRQARDLLREWRGREIDKTDGFLLLFDSAQDGLGYALAYHRVLVALEAALQGAHEGLKLRARAGLHVGLVTLRETPAGDVALGAKPVEVEGLAKPLAARVMATALGGQTLLTATAVQALGTTPHRIQNHGHWRVKGLDAPLELFEVGPVGPSTAPFMPPPDGDKVYRVVRQGSLWLPARELRHGLPAERDAFVGRSSTLQEIARRFEADARLVSLVGIGGCGKTRLATRFGWAWLGDFPGGVWFCDLASARSLEGLTHAVAQGLDVPLGKDDPVLQLGHAIAGRSECLVILDNFEHLARHAESTLGHWLERAPRARFLVTTREVLGIIGEETLGVAPLNAADAEQLFMRRAAAAKFEFVASTEEQVAITKLVGLLDGLPLAIELAAARVRSLSPRMLLARMSERFKLLASGGGRLDRQSTLRTTFDWSWELLTAAEKSALAQLSVFEGGFTMEAAEGVLDLSGIPSSSAAPWTMDVVTSLVDKSFVRSLVDERYDLLVSVQAYAAEHLQTAGRFEDSGPQAQRAAQLRHAQWFAALGPERALECGCADIDNMATACWRGVNTGDAELAAGALRGAWAAITLQGPFKAGVDMAKAVCDMPTLGGVARAQAHAVLGHALESSGQRGQADAQYAMALPLAVAAGDLRCQAEVLVRQGGLHGGPSGRAQLEQALTLARQLGDPEWECAATNGLGNLEFAQGRMADAQRHFEAGLALSRRAGLRRWQGSLLGNMGNLQASIGAMDAARRCNEEALAVARELGDRRREGNGLSNLAMLNFLQGRLDEALSAAETAHTLACELGHQILVSTALCNLGLIHGALGRLDSALDRMKAAVALNRSLGNSHALGQALGHCGVAQARVGQFVAAKALLDEGHQLLVASDDPFSLGLLVCNQAESHWLSGDVPAAQASLERARSLFESSGASPSSELGLALKRASTVVLSVGV